MLDIMNDLNLWLDMFLEDGQEPTEFLAKFSKNVDVAYQSQGELYFDIIGDAFLKGRLTIETEKYPNQKIWLEINIKSDANLTDQQLEKYWGGFSELPKMRPTGITELLFNDVETKEKYKFSPTIYAHRLNGIDDSTPSIVKILIRRDPLNKI